MVPREDPYKRTERLQREKVREPGRASVSAGMDLQPVEDQGTLAPRGPADTDIGKGLIMAPAHVERGAVGAVESTLNLPRDVIQSVGAPARAAFDPNVSALFSEGGPAGDPATLPQRFAEAYQKGGHQEQQQKLNNLPRFDLSAAKIPIPEGMQSVTGQLEEGLAQFLVGRVGLGKLAPGGGIFPQLGKDIATTGAVFDAKSGRLADIIDLNAIPAGPLRDYATWLRTQPEDSPIVGRFKNMLEDLTLSGPALAPQAVVRGAQAAGNALTAPRAPAAAPAPAPAAASPPITAVPPTAPRAAQGGPSGAGQQAGAPPVVNAVPAAPVLSKGQQRVARDTAKILSRIMRSSRIKDADVAGYLPGAIQRFKSLNDSRVPFAFFLEEDLPQHFPSVADEVITKLQTWGRERNAATGAQDTSKKTTQGTIKTLRGSQEDFLTEQAEANMFKGSLIGREDQILRDLQETGRKGYEPVLSRAREITDGKRSPGLDERTGVEELRALLQRPVFRDRIPPDVRMTAEAEGFDLQHAIETDPIGAAHWLQSNLRRLEDAAEDLGGKATPASLAYGKMRSDVLGSLQKAAPGYEGARNRYGDQFGAKEAVNFGKGLFTTARNARDSAKLIRKFKALTKRQQTVALMSIRDELLNQFRGTREGAAAKITRLQEEGTLEILDDLGARGKRVADSIRKIAKENERLRAIDQGSGSPTHANQVGAKSSKEIVQSPVNKAIGSFGDPKSLPVTILADLAAMNVGLPPIVTAGKIGSAIVDKFGNPSAKVLSRATEGLYGLPPAQAPTGNALKAPRAPRIPNAPKQEVLPPEDLGSLLRQLDEVERDPARRGGPEGARLLKLIDKARKQPGQGRNALATPSAPPPARKPPVQQGVGMGGPRIPPELAGTAIGAYGGYALAPEDQKAAGLIGGALGGAGMGRAARFIVENPNALRNALTPAPKYQLKGANDRGIIDRVTSPKVRDSDAELRSGFFNPSQREYPRDLIQEDNGSGVQMNRDTFGSPIGKPDMTANDSPMTEAKAAYEANLMALMTPQEQALYRWGQLPKAREDELNEALFSRYFGSDDEVFSLSEPERPEPKPPQRPNLTPIDGGKKPPPKQNSFFSSGSKPQLDMSEGAGMDSGARQMGNLGKAWRPGQYEFGPVRFYFGEHVNAPTDDPSVMKAVYDRINKQDWKMEKVRLEDLTTGGQDAIDPRFRGVPLPGGFENKPVIVVRANGHLYIEDGNHRLVAAAERGQKEITAAVINLDPAEEGSSRLLAGTGREFIAPTASGVAGFAAGSDTDGDGKISLAERLATAGMSFFATAAFQPAIKDIIKSARGKGAKSAFEKIPDDYFEGLSQEQRAELAKGHIFSQILEAGDMTPEQIAGLEKVPTGEIKRLVNLPDAHLRQSRDTQFQPPARQGPGGSGGKPPGGTVPTRELLGEAVSHPPYTKDPTAKQALQSAKSGKQYTEQVVPLASITPTQAHVNPDYRGTLADAVESPNGKPVLVKYHGRYYIDDGHHRIMDAASGGANSVDARVIDLDASASGTALGKPPGEGGGERVANTTPPPPVVGGGVGAAPKKSAPKPKPPISKAEEEQRKVVAAARAAYKRKWNRSFDHLRKIPQEEFVSEEFKRMVAEEAKLSKIQENDARLRALGGRAKDAGVAIKKAVTSVDAQGGSLRGGAKFAGAVALGGIGMAAANHFLGGSREKDKEPKPLNPNDPGYTWSKMKERNDAMRRLQEALDEEGYWPRVQERIDPATGKIIRSGKNVEKTGAYGSATKDALAAWLGRDPDNPDDPITENELMRLLSGNGYADDKGVWRYGDGQPVPLPN